MHYQLYTPVELATFLSVRHAGFVEVPLPRFREWRKTKTQLEQRQPAASWHHSINLERYSGGIQVNLPSRKGHEGSKILGKMHRELSGPYDRSAKNEVEQKHEQKQILTHNYHDYHHISSYKIHPLWEPPLRLFCGRANACFHETYRRALTCICYTGAQTTLTQLCGLKPVKLGSSNGCRMHKRNCETAIYKCCVYESSKSAWGMSMGTCIYKYIYIYVCVCVCVWHISIYIYMYVIYIYMCDICMYMTHVLVNYTCANVYMYIYIYICWWG